MIPIRLELKNFLPYRVPDPLQFEGIHLACLTGPNGAGKSSILDAITWALWGKARTTRDDDLMHQGQAEMSVQLDFEQEKVLYRVLRRRSRSKKSSNGQLDLFVIKADGGATVISEPSMRATQTKINDLLRLDYETFVHSAFLQQGKADAFTTQTPAQRKRILADILGLDQWSVYEDRTKAHLKQLEQNIFYHSQRIDEINQELKQRPGLERELLDAEQHHAEAEEQFKQAQALEDELRNVPNLLKQEQTNLANSERRVTDFERDLAETLKAIDRQTQQIEELETLIENADEILAGYDAYQNAQALDEDLSTKLGELRTIEEQRTELEKQLASEHARLETTLGTLQKQFQVDEAVIARNPQTELAQITERLYALEEQEVQYHAQKETHNELRENLAAQKQALSTLEKEGQALNKKIEDLDTLVGVATCPCCGQTMDESHRLAHRQEVEAERDAKRAEYRDIRDEIAGLDSRLSALTAEIARLEDGIYDIPGLNAEVGQLRAQVAEVEQAQARLKDNQAQQAEITDILQKNSFAPDIRQQLEAVNQQIAALDYNKQSHESAREDLKRYRDFQQRKVQLEYAQTALPNLLEERDGSLNRQQRLQENIDSVAKEINAMQAHIVELTAQKLEFERREKETRAKHTAQQTALHRLVNVQQRLGSLDSQEKRKADHEQKVEALRYEEGIYKELRTAFSKNGIPAMIIETAIPELESTANHLLARMTDGRMALQLNTQREKISGGMAETLDIAIADELGTRNYEMYSGGEAFRINFALRVALSQLLARRAGAHLRTLFIDEGFGTQDEDGREKLVQAINAIQAEFDLILVITHIDELRDSFPVHVVVEKSESGSRISIR